jgi:phosphate transport system protein
MPDKHLSSQFDAELAALSGRVLTMGGAVEAQLRQAMQALRDFSSEGAAQVLRQEAEINAMELRIDAELSTVIARRQPTARDLRLLIAVSKAIANLERVGDEAARIARVVQRQEMAGGSSRIRQPVLDLALVAELAVTQLRKVLDAFARLDTDAALAVLRADDQIDREFEGLMRKLITYMMEDPRTISASIDVVFVAKAIERIGDHAKNIAESIIYVVKGADVRHRSIEAAEQATRAG